MKDSQCFASSLYLKKPECVMALLMVMTVCLLVYTALDYRIRNALQDIGEAYRMKVDEMQKKLSEKAEKDPRHHWRHAQHDMNTKMPATS